MAGIDTVLQSDHDRLVHNAGLTAANCQAPGRRRPPAVTNRRVDLDQCTLTQLAITASLSTHSLSDNLIAADPDQCCTTAFPIREWPFDQHDIPTKGSVHAESLKMQKTSALPGLIFVVIIGIGLAFAYAGYSSSAYGLSLTIAVGTFVIAAVASYSIKIADQWNRTVVLRLGRFRSLEGPGLFFIIPIVETVPYWIDTRVITSSFKAEKTLTKDTVPVDVDAVLFWKVVDPKRAALDVADYNSAISWASQTALRDVIGKTMLSDMLEGREKIGSELQKIIDIRTEPWGINVISVEVKDVLIPAALQDAMSMQAQAERERQARVILEILEKLASPEFRRNFGSGG